MAISRMQQPRQLYGLGSFVKKTVGKVTKPFTKVAKKIVPREIAGIMRTAAPFLPPGYREAAYLLGTAKQTGRISPIDLALVAAPYANKALGKTDAGFFAETFPRANATLFGAPEVTTRGALSGTAPSALRSPVQPDSLLQSYNLPGFGPERIVSPESTGLFGTGGKMFQFGSDQGGILDNVEAFRDQSKLGNLLLGGKDAGTFSKSKIAGLGIGTLSLIQNSKTPEEAGNALVAATGDSDDYERGVQMFSSLPQGIFDIPDAYRLPAQSGGLMRTNYARGAGDKGVVNPFQPKPQGPVLPDEDKPFTPKPLKPIKMTSVDDPFYRGGDEDEHSFRMFNKPYKELNADELEEFREEMMRLMNKFSSKDDDKGIMMAKFDLLEYQEEFERVFPEMREKRGTEEYMDMLEDYFRGLASKDKEGIMMVGGENNRVRELLLKEETEGLSEDEKEELRQLIKTISAQAPMLSDKEGIMMAKEGGRANLALGTNPTTEESGLGGLPIEADMRYTGGFMPYGEVEKADDVPARLSKNEFVFTADAVRAAGGGSVNEGAKKMYQAMKQLEKKPEAKGMMA